MMAHQRSYSILLFTSIFSWAALLNSFFAAEMHPVGMQSKITNVQPMTGIVLWTTNEAVATAPIQLEYSYMTYAEIVKSEGVYDWAKLERLLDKVSSRGHQLVLRWHDTYVGKPTGVPQYITKLPGYKTVREKSENKLTEFPDWSHAELRRFVLEFFSQFASKYDSDSRLAFLEVGFGLWAEYHIYDGPMRLGETFPSKDFQTEFVTHLSRCLRVTPWIISVDAADTETTPFVDNAALLTLPFGLFDDSFNHARHQKENEPNWNALGRERWKLAPTGGEFSFIKKVDQTKALTESGPHGIPFEKQAADFHISFIIGDDQPRFQKSDRIREAGIACGYKFRIEKLEASEERSRIEIKNIGIAPIYYDAYPTVNGVRASTSLKGLLPGEKRDFMISSGGNAPVLTIECDRLLQNQTIGFEADLK